MRWMIAAFVAVLVAAGSSYVATADNVQFGFWGWNRLPDRLTVGGHEYKRSAHCTGTVARSIDLRRRATLWTVIGPRRAIYLGYLVPAVGRERKPLAAYLSVGENCPFRVYEPAAGA